jgi:glycine oxidase
MFDCIVVGGGLIGMLTARELRLAGNDVLLLERNQVGAESSWAGGGILSPLYPWRYPDALTALAKWSQDRYPEFARVLIEKTGVDPEYIKSGLLILDPEEKNAALDWVDHTHSNIEYIDQAEIQNIAPAISQQYGEGLWMPDVSQLRNPRLIKAVYEIIKSEGVKIQVLTEVSGFDVSHGRVKRIHTNKGSISGNKVVVCCGAWSAKLLKQSGTHLEIEPVRGQMLLLKAKPELLSPMVMKEGHYLIPRRDGCVLVGSTLEYVGFDKSITEEAKTELYQAAITMAPVFADCKIERHWAGLRPGSPHGIPYIGKMPEIEDLYINAGHFRNGVVTALASAHLLVDIVMERRPILNFEPYMPARKKEGESDKNI